MRTGLKWEACRNAERGARYVVCNADEGEPGTFKDRVLLAAHADLVFEGMTLCALAIGAQKGMLYLRGEYRYLLDHLHAVLERRRGAKLLGADILGRQDFDFDIEIHLGAGAYICGEESALIESLEGKRGTPRNRPPFPVTHGYLGQPTVVNNVETFAASCLVAQRGSAWYAGIGTSAIGRHQDAERLRRLRRGPASMNTLSASACAEVLEDCGASDTRRRCRSAAPSGV